MSVSQASATLTELAAEIGLTVAGPNAASVDREARFPHESIEALRSQQLLSVLVPTELGGGGASLSATGAIVQELGRHCSSTGMVYAMHQIQVACLVRHGHNDRLRQLQNDLVAEQLLFASATTEIGIGGDVRSSGCAVQRAGSQFSLTKQAPVISYGEYADAIFATARRNEDSPPSDQVLAVCRKADTTLERTSEWDTLGFRGTCSPGFILTATGPAGDILDEPYGDISAATMLPVSHILWGHLWLGMATAAVDTARRFVRGAARAKPGTMPPAATRLAELVAVHQQLADLVHGAARSFDEFAGDADELGGVGLAIAYNSLKVSASTLLVDIVTRAMVVIGIMSYRQDSPFCLGRVLRDAYGAPLMVNNDRILLNNAQLLLVHKG